MPCKSSRTCACELLPSNAQR